MNIWLLLRSRGIKIFVGAVFLLGASAQGVFAEDMIAQPILFACLPDAPVQITKNNNFALAFGSDTVFGCALKNTKNDAAYEAVLIGKQMDESGVVAISSNMVTLPADGTTQIALQFPAVFRPGMYQYTFSLTEKTTAEPLAREAILTGVLTGSAQASIVSATVNQTEYHWAGPFALTVKVAHPPEQSLDQVPLFLTLSMQNKQGHECALLEKDIPVQQIEDTYQLHFPQGADCTNAVVVSLRTKDGSVKDQTILAVPLPEGGATLLQRGLADVIRVPKILMAAVFLTIVGCFVLASYFVVRKWRRRTF
jgi:hypothetical protein